MHPPGAIVGFPIATAGAAVVVVFGGGLNSLLSIVDGGARAKLLRKNFFSDAPVRESTPAAAMARSAAFNADCT
jgi:hypothetical protein